jgi:prophage regulatory protein
MNNDEPSRILSPRDVSRRTSLSRTTLWRMSNCAGPDRFPAPITLSANRIGWRQSEVDAWIAARPQKGGV